MNVKPNERFLENMRRLKAEFDTDILTGKRKNAKATDKATNSNKETHEPERD